MSFKGEYIVQQIETGRFDSMTIRTADLKMIIEALNEVTPPELSRGFTSFADNAENGRYVVELFKFNEKTGGGRKFDHEQKKSLLYVVAGNQSQSSMTGGHDYVDKIIKLQQELANAEMEKRIKAIEDNNSNKMYSMLERLFLMMQAPKSASPAAISGPPKPAQSATPEGEFMAMFERWQSADNKLPETVAALVKMAESDPENYVRYRDIIHKMGTNDQA